MSWFDRVLAVPAIGVRFRPWFRTSADYVRDLEQVFEEMAPNGAADVNVNPAEVEFHDKKGLLGKVTSEDLVVQFSYRPELKEVPGEVPRLHYPAEVERFTVLCERVERLSALVSRALLRVPRPVARIGLVADAKLDRAAPPPGVELLLKHLGSPWEEGLSECRGALTAVIRKKDGEFHRCHHTVVMAETPDTPLLFKLDWQHVFDPPRPMSADELIKAFSAVREGALEYFERFGRGELKYD